MSRRASYSRREHEVHERARRAPDPRCADCGHFRSEHRPSPYFDRRPWCIADTGSGEACACERFVLSDGEAATWLAGRLARWADR